MKVVELAGGLPVGFRERDLTNERETGFIFSSWLRGHHKGGDWPRRMGIPDCAPSPVGKSCGCCRFSHRRYFDEHKKVVARLLERSRVVVACNPALERQVLGYVVFEPGVLHWIFVKETFRWDRDAEAHPRLGTALLAEAFGGDGLVTFGRVACTHWTMNAERLADKWGLTYRPFMLEER